MSNYEGNNNEFEEEVEIVTLLDEEGEEHEFELIDVIEVDDCEYAILISPDEEATEAIALKKTVDEEGNEVLIDIEDEEEWQKVVSAWEELVEGDI